MKIEATPKHAKVRVPSSLRALVRSECCNHLDGQHLGELPCAVLAGRRCGWFERALLPVASQQVQEAYSQMVSNGGQVHRRIASRHCQCGAALEPRQRYCETCRKERRRRSARKAQRKRRVPVSS